MPKCNPIVFKRSLLAAAVVSLSACSSLPQVPVPDVDLGSVGSGIAKAGRATADAGRKTWSTTTYLLGFSDAKERDSSNPSDDELLVAREDVNQVLPMEDPVVVTPANKDQPVIIQQATASTEGMRPATQASDDVQLAVNEAEQATDLQLIEEDLIHEVGASETLWGIAKKTTGDANNWHVLADVNDLAQNATVFPGQQIVIPSSMVKPGYDAPLSGAEADVAATTQDVNVSGTELENAQQLSSATIQSDTTDAVEDVVVAVADEQQPVADGAAQLAAAGEDATAIKLNEGETLWDFAKRTTGDATNWQAIAKQNNFSEKQSVTVRPGQTIFVPQSLIKGDADVASAAQGTATDQTDTVAAAVESTDAEATTAVAAAAQAAAAESAAAREQAAAALPATDTLQTPALETAAVDTQAIQTTEALAATASALDESQPMKIVEATYKTNDTLTPVSTGQDASQVIVENTNIPAEIMVSGTYYPKAVYNNADFSSSLLMRVSPGTTLQVSRAMGSWFEVETDKGVGYVHQRDIK